MRPIIAPNANPKIGLFGTGSKYLLVNGCCGNILVCRWMRKGQHGFVGNSVLNNYCNRRFRSLYMATAGTMFLTFGCAERVDLSRYRHFSRGLALAIACMLRLVAECF